MQSFQFEGLRMLRINYVETWIRLFKHKKIFNNHKNHVMWLPENETIEAAETKRVD